MKRDEFQMWAKIDVRWGDMDSMGHVNNTKYFTYLETARIHLFAELGLLGAFGSDGQGMSLAHTGCNFRREVRYPNWLDIGSSVTKVGTSSFHLRHGMFFVDTDDLAADATSVVVWTDFTQGRSMPLPVEVRAKLEEYLAEHKG